MASFLPTHVYDQYRVTKIEAGQLTMLVNLMGFALREVGGYISDRVGGIKTLNDVLSLVSATLVLCGLAGQSLVVTTLLFVLYFAALKAGNSALFQLVPLRWPVTTAVAGSITRDKGKFGGGFISNPKGQSKLHLAIYL